jgi:hypothetical protein
MDFFFQLIFANYWKFSPIFETTKIEKTKTLLTTQVPPAALLHTIIYPLLGRRKSGSLAPWIQTKPIMPENP